MKSLHLHSCLRLVIVGLATISASVVSAATPAKDIRQEKSSTLLHEALASDSTVARRLIEEELFRRAREERLSLTLKPGSTGGPELPSGWKARKATGVAPATEAGEKPAAGDKNDVTASQIENALTSAGFGVTSGYGYFFRSQRLGVTTKLTYNFYRLYTKRSALGTVAGNEPDSPWFGSKLTSLCGWIGTTAAKVSNRAGTATESPIVFGVSGGVGHVSGRSSAVFFDLGGAVFSNRSFARIEPYAGVSVDLELFAKLAAKLSVKSGN